MLRGLDRGLLPLLRGPADLVVDLRVRVSRQHPPDQVLCVPQRQCRLARDRDTATAQVEGGDVGRILDQVDLARRLAHHPLRLGMPLPADVHHLVALERQVLDQLVRTHDVRARRVHGRESELDGALHDLWRDSVGREDHRAVLDELEAGQPVGLVHQSNPLLLQVVRGVGVVHEHAQHVNRSLRLLPDALGDPEGVDDTVAVPPGGDFENLHRSWSLRARSE